jgi:Putative prokaryotic signal transducing protein
VSERQLICPTCARSFAASERFCGACGMPLVHQQDGEPRPSARQRHARKIKRQYTEGPAVVVARARNQVEAEFIEGLLLEEGIPCVQRSPIGGYGPLAGPRELLVPASGAQAAREALAWKPAAEQWKGDGERTERAGATRGPARPPRS